MLQDYKPIPPSASNAFDNLYFPVAINDRKQVKFNKIKNLTNLIFILVFLWLPAWWGMQT